MMTAEQLKNSILQLAMQGKLVEQRLEEGTGEELYKEILKEREKLVQRGKIKKEKVQTEKNEEFPFDIPESWKWAKLNDIVAKTIKRGKSPKYTQKSNTLVFAQKCNTKAGIIDISLCLFLDDNLLSKYPEEEFMINNDIVINSTGNGTLGRVNIYIDSDNPLGIPIVPDSHVTVIRCNRHMEVEYVLYCLKYYQPYMEKLGSGSTNQTELSAGILKELAFPIPPLAEQKRIVAKIEELMPFVEQYAAASTKLNTLNTSFPDMMKKSILQEAVQGKLVPQDPNDEPASVLLKKIAEEKKRLIKEGKIKKQKPLPEITEDEIPFDIPESWEWVRLGSIGSWGSGATPSRTKAEYYGGEVPWLKTGDLNDDYINEVPESITQLALNNTSVRLNPIGSVLMAMYGATIGKLGIANIPLTTNQACCACIPYKGIYNKYLFYYLLAMRSRFIKMGEGGAQPNISKEKIISTIMALPPLEEQKRIVKRLDCLLPKVNELIECSTQ